MEFINPPARRERAKENKIIKDLLHEKGIITKEEITNKKKSIKSKK